MAANLLPIDTALSSAASFVIGVRDKKQVTIEFQFPPKILVDNRTGSWDEVELPGDQPVSVYKTSGARKFTLEWTYVIGATPGWDTDRVRTQITSLRNYYTKSSNVLLEGFIVYLKIWKLGGTEEMTFRLGNIDISHGKALFVPSTGNNTPSNDQILLAHPVITNIKVAMQPWIKGGPSTLATTQATLNKKYGEGQPKIDVKPLQGTVPADWQ